jgi:catechol 2,3-dioxygenase-like lactoylglutathione lyase family enzyme
VETHLGHIQVNVNADNVPFYKDLMTFLGWRVIAEDDGFLGVLGGNNASLWFAGGAKAVDNDYDGPGINHLAIGTAAQGDVDAAAEYLRGKGVELLFDTPQHRPDFAGDGPNTYYQVMFESPDHILWEVVYTGPKS